MSRRQGPPSPSREPATSKAGRHHYGARLGLARVDISAPTPTLGEERVQEGQDRLYNMQVGATHAHPPTHSLRGRNITPFADLGQDPQGQVRRTQALLHALHQDGAPV